MMALNMTHQIGSLMGTPVPEGGSSTPTSELSGSAAMNGSTVWNKSPMPDIRCRIKKSNGADGDAMLSPPVSPCRSPVFGSQIFPRDMAVACQALESTDGMTATEEEDAVKKEHFGAADVKKVERDGVPVYVMLPLDSVKPGGGGVNRKKAMNASMMALRSAGVEGVMVDVWWGVVEKERPGEYDWSGYLELMEMAKKHGLKVQAVMSFHKCGGNVGDSVTIPLPRWVGEAIDHDNDLAYTDQWGRRNCEYISLGCDTLPVLKGRTPVECYADFMRSFRERFRNFLGSTITEVQVGMGPAGELRYPSYPEQNGTWKFPGIGAFQCFDKYTLSSLKAAAEAEGKPKWGHGGPTDAGGYNNWPEDTDFFRHDGGWCSPYGEFFLTWYSGLLLDHGDRILSAATSIFREDFSKGVKISAKIAGIHWHYGTRSHPAELTAGYYNTRRRDGYLPIAQMLGRHGAIFNFTCLEMRNFEQPGEAQCMPEGLVRQVGLATTQAGVELAGENALPRYDEAAFDQIVRTAAKGGNDGDLGMMCGFTYLRMSPSLFHPDNWRKFVAFLRRMSEGKGRRSGGKCLEEVEREAAPLVQKAVVRLSSG